ncbi:hypothetical protein K493DRAFT_376608 [Basidiobolus meristosporus CBS 931.73]|uniref:BHLH domain-containing protein n=1 Tax=Basidiobolus meristosporus CBS 931.73 TaxID=1314790 RepID=A0A1Y1Y3L3_9FUNG|nr:hypothetical protein K493DRAFT_376608 [Basidiobolus meristosporus CBS 931.73]|eukprot:ORX92611.1 hypothetical protein K493DRAFT_376608 [Basidiobolus meristosporus CBS 931.73]
MPSLPVNTFKPVPDSCPGPASNIPGMKKPVSRRLRAYSFNDSIRQFHPDKLRRKKATRKRESYVMHGIDILNKDNVDSEAVIDRMQQQREQHNRVERRRRDLINSSIEELSGMIPLARDHGVKFARGNVLRLTIDFIKELQQEVMLLKSENENLRSSLAHHQNPVNSLPVIIVNQPEDTLVSGIHAANSSTSCESDVRTPTIGQELSLESKHTCHPPTSITQLLSPAHSPIFP